MSRVEVELIGGPRDGAIVVVSQDVYVSGRFVFPEFIGSSINPKPEDIAFRERSYIRGPGYSPEGFIRFYYERT